MLTLSTKCYLFLLQGNILVNKTDLPYTSTNTLAGPTVTRPVQEPLAVTHLENRLYMSAQLSQNFFYFFAVQGFLS